MADYSLPGMGRAFGGQAMDAAHGASRGISADLLGGPVDLISLLLRTAGMPIPSDPVGGSEWIGGKLESAGLLRPQTGSPPESVGRLAGGLLATPQTVGKVGMAAEQGVKSLGMAAGQKIDDAMMGRGGLLGAALKPSQPMPITAYHGSPHKFDKFDSSKIGTGEGAQAYGHGLYLSEAPAVAKDYAEKLSSAGLARRTLAQNAGQTDAAIAAAEQSVRNYQALIANGGGGDPRRAHGMLTLAQKKLTDLQAMKSGTLDEAGNLYKVDLPDEQIAKMLDWDKPLSQQPEAVRKALSKAPFETKGIGDPTGRQLLEMAQGYAGAGPGGMPGSNPAAGSDLLRSLGISGIKYLDAGSRTAGQGSRNFVVFDDQIPNIMERNNQPIGGLLGTR